MTVPLNTDVSNYLELVARQNYPSLETLTVDEARQQQVSLILLSQGSEYSSAEQAWIPERLGGVPVHRYPGSTDRIAVYLHGGGWVLGDLETSDFPARAIREALGATTISVGYRRSPEVRHPAARDDVAAVIREIRHQYPHACISIIGDSAGATLALDFAIAGRDDLTLRTDALLLIYPAVDPLQKHQSHSDFAEGYLLTRETMSWFWRNYLTEPEGSRDFFLTLPEDCSMLPWIIVSTAGYDPLRDEGDQLTTDLRARGARVERTSFPALIHGWWDAVGTIPTAREARDTLLTQLADLLVERTSS